jgi:hypothetical protein
VRTREHYNTLWVFVFVMLSDIFKVGTMFWVTDAFYHSKPFMMLILNIDFIDDVRQKIRFTAFYSDRNSVETHVSTYDNTSCILDYIQVQIYTVIPGA